MATHKDVQNPWRDPYPNELYRETHFSLRIGQYVDARARNTQASYDEDVARFLAQNPEIQSHEQIFDSIKIELWAESAGGQQRPDRVYGLGALAGNVVHENLFCALVLPKSSSARSAELSPEMQAIITRMNEELQSQKLVLQNQNELLESQKQALEAQNKVLARKDETENKLMKEMNVFRKFQKMMTKKFMGRRKSRKTSDSSSPASSQFSPTPHQIHDLIKYMTTNNDEEEDVDSE